jgi:hypothetical protein
VAERVVAAYLLGGRSNLLAGPLEELHVLLKVILVTLVDHVLLLQKV